MGGIECVGRRQFKDLFAIHILYMHKQLALYVQVVDSVL